EESVRGQAADRDDASRVRAAQLSRRASRGGGPPGRTAPGGVGISRHGYQHANRRFRDREIEKEDRSRSPPSAVPADGARGRLLPDRRRRGGSAEAEGQTLPGPTLTRL